MKKLLAILAFVFCGSTAAFADCSPSGITAAINAALPSQAVGAITPTALRNVLVSTFACYTPSGVIPPSGSRPSLTSNLTLYVRPGSSGATCLADTDAAACPTVQQAVDRAYSYDLSSFAITIQVRAGVYGAASFMGPFTGQRAQGDYPSVTLQGDCTNSTTWSSVVLAGSGQDAVTSRYGAWVGVKCIRVQTTTSGSGLTALNGGILYYDQIDFGTVAQGHKDVENAGSVMRIYGSASYRITGNSGSDHMHVDEGGMAYDTNASVTCAGVTQFTGDTVGVAGLYYAPGMTFSGCGAVTNVGNSKRYFVHDYGRIIINAAGNPTYFPGSNAGTTQLDGLYDYIKGDDGYVIVGTDNTKGNLFAYGQKLQLVGTNAGITNIVSCGNASNTVSTACSLLMATGAGGARQWSLTLAEGGAGTAALAEFIGTGITSYSITMQDSASINFGTNNVGRWQIGGNGNLYPFAAYDIAQAGTRVGTLYTTNVNFSGTMTAPGGAGVTCGSINAATVTVSAGIVTHC